MQDHISKPIDPAVLYATVRHHCRRSMEVAALPADAASAAPAPPVASSPTGNGLPVVAGLDTADGLLRLAGNQPLYLKLLRQFVEQQADAPTRLSALLASGDHATAERLAHTIKGVAGNLGAGPVQTAAAELEQAIAASAPPAEIEAARNTLDARLSALVGRLRLALRVEEAVAAIPADEAPPDPRALAAAIDQLQAYLRDFDAAAIDHLEANRALFEAVLPPDALAQLQAHLEAFAFDEALALLAPVSERLQGGAAGGVAAGPPSTVTTIEPARGRAAIEQLKQHLVEYDAAALDLLEAESALFSSLLGPEAFAELRQRVEAYAFDEAAVLLDAAARQSELEIEHDDSAPSTGTAATTDDPHAVQRAIDQLHEYLADWDAVAVDYLEANRELVRARFSREAFAELEQRIKAFAFDEARAQLKEAMTSHAG
jgi:HPt (histidine-containing phosphotransfer) domain-containing protein